MQASYLPPPPPPTAAEDGPDGPRSEPSTQKPPMSIGGPPSAPGRPHRPARQPTVVGHSGPNMVRGASLRAGGAAARDAVPRPYLLRRMRDSKGASGWFTKGFDRDTLAMLDRIEPVCQALGVRATLTLFADADHSFHAPVRQAAARMRKCSAKCSTRSPAGSARSPQSPSASAIRPSAPTTMRHQANRAKPWRET